MSPRLRFLLIASLILNILAVGIGVGAGIVWLRDGRPAAARRGLQFAGDRLHPDQRRAFRMQLRAARRDARPLVRAARAARTEAAALLAAPTLDRAALDAALDRARTADLALRARLERRATAFAATLPQADRARLGQALLRRAPDARPGPTDTPAPAR